MYAVTVYTKTRNATEESLNMGVYSMHMHMFILLLLILTLIPKTVCCLSLRVFFCSDHVGCQIWL